MIGGIASSARYDGVFDANRGNVGTSNISLAVEREPRQAYFVGWRSIHDTDSNLSGFGGNYKLSEKHTVALREYYDIDEGRNASTELVYIRKWPRWYTAVMLDIDRALDDVGVNLSSGRREEGRADRLGGAGPEVGQEGPAASVVTERQSFVVGGQVLRDHHTRGKVSARLVMAIKNSGSGSFGRRHDQDVRAKLPLVTVLLPPGQRCVSDVRSKRRGA